MRIHVMLVPLYIFKLTSASVLFLYIILYWLRKKKYSIRFSNIINDSIILLWYLTHLVVLVTCHMATGKLRLYVLLGVT